MEKWQVQKAKAHLSELIDKATNDGPQVITRYGEDTVVVLSKREFDLLSQRKPTLVEFLMSGPKFDDLDELIGPRTDMGRKVDLEE